MTTIDRDFRLDTPRLYLSHLDADSAPQRAFVVRLYNAPAFVAALGDAGVHTPEDARAFLAARRALHDTHGFGAYLVSLRETGEPIGYVGMMHRGAHTLPDSVGFAFLDEVHGRGYATEAARALMQYARESRGVTQVLGFTSPSNTRSRRALERLGLVYRGEMLLAAFQDRGADESAVYATSEVGDLAAYGVVDIRGIS